LWLTFFSFQFAPCTCDAIKIVISNYFPPCCFIVARVIFLCFEIEGETMKLITFLTKDFMAFRTKLLIENVKDVLHHFNFYFFYFDLLMMKEVGDWVKAQNTIWYSNLFMIQYENQRWVEHL